MVLHSLAAQWDGVPRSFYELRFVITPFLPLLTLVALGMIIVGYAWRLHKHGQTVAMPSISEMLGIMLLIGCLITFWTIPDDESKGMILIFFILMMLPAVGFSMFVIGFVLIIVPISDAKKKFGFFLLGLGAALTGLALPLFIR